MAVAESLPPDGAVALHRRALTALADPALGAPDLARLAHHAEAAGDGPAVLRYAPAAGERRRPPGPRARPSTITGGPCRSPRESTPIRVPNCSSDLRSTRISPTCAPRLWTRLRRRSRSTGGVVTSSAKAPPGAQLARAYSSLAGLSTLEGDPTPTLEWGAKAIALAEEVGDTEALVHALNNVGSCELNHGSAGGHAALDVVVRGIEYTAKLGLEAWQKCLVGTRAVSELALGRWDAAAATAQSILDGPRDQVIGPRSDALVTLALVRARRGDPGVWPLLDEALQTAIEADELELLAPAASARAETAWLEGRPDAIGAETELAYDRACRLRDDPLVGELACWRARGGLPVDPPMESRTAIASS
jgi:hypothetical protein